MLIFLKKKICLAYWVSRNFWFAILLMMNQHYVFKRAKAGIEAVSKASDTLVTKGHFLLVPR